MSDVASDVGGEAPFETESPTDAESAFDRVFDEVCEAGRQASETIAAEPIWSLVLATVSGLALGLILGGGGRRREVYVLRE
ncbi:MAG: hypothetical protein ACRED8_01915 [Caulobacteraceae bacterium]